MLVGVLALAGAACGDSKSDATGGGEEATCPDFDDAVAEGSINVSGSSTVAPITQQAADCFAEMGGTEDITVDDPGTGDGFELFCDGETDISDASRPIERGGGRGLRGRRHRVHRAEGRLRRHRGHDQPGQRRRRVPELRRPLRPGRPRVRGRRQLDRRQDARHRARLGHRVPRRSTSTITAPGEESGTYDSFVEIALGDIAEARLEAGAITEDAGRARPGPTTRRRPTTTPSSRPSRAPTARFGWVGFAFAEEAGDGVKELAVAAEPAASASPRRRDDRRRHLPAVPVAVHLRERGQAPRRTRPSPPTSTTTSTTASTLVERRPATCPARRPGRPDEPATRWDGTATTAVGHGGRWPSHVGDRTDRARRPQLDDLRGDPRRHRARESDRAARCSPRRRCCRSSSAR